MSANIPSLKASVGSWLSQLICGLSGHELVLNAEPGRLSLKCMSCPYETPGWAIKEKSFGRVGRAAAGVLVEQHVS